MIDYHILFKLPTRSRPKRAFEVLDATIKNLVQSDKNFTFLISIDEDDLTMNNDNSISKLNAYPNMIIKIGKSKCKVEAINRDMDAVTDWDIVILLSDDMVPVKFGFDEIIRKAYKDYFSDLDGVTWFNDGFQGHRLNTLCILGKKYYNRFNYIYHPDYMSLYCDNEFTQVANLLGKHKYFNEVLIEHRHFSIGNNKKNYDALYKKNDSLMGRDARIFKLRKSKNFDIK